jgi:hypothetical protein
MSSDIDLQQSKSEITVDLGLQLDLNVEVQFQAQPQLLTSVLSALLFTTAAASETSESLASGVSDLVDGVTSSVLDHLASSADGIASRNVLGDVV